MIHLVPNLFCCMYNTINKYKTQSKIKSQPLIDVSNPIRYLGRSDLKIPYITSSVLSVTMTSVLSLF